MTERTYGKLNNKKCVMSIDEAMGYLATDSFKHDIKALLNAQHELTLKIVYEFLKTELKHDKDRNVIIPRRYLREIGQKANIGYKQG